MGYFTDSADRYGVVVTYQAVKKVAGKCPKCEHPFVLTFTTEQEGGSYKEGDDYRCPCGGFAYYPDSDRCTEDDHGKPDGYHPQKLREALKELDEAMAAT